jgi:segregation and condensation protein B
MTYDLKLLTRILEGVLFASSEPVSMETMLSLFEVEPIPEKEEIRQALSELAKAYEGHGVELKEVASGFQFRVHIDLASWIQKLYAEKPAKYSRALLEVLAIIAYRQPITRGEIEEIRGVNVNTYMIKTLMDHHWIRLVGHREVPGRPGLYGTTKYFLDHFGLKNLSELPSLPDSASRGEALDKQVADQLGLVVSEETNTIIPEEEQRITENDERESNLDNEELYIEDKFISKTTGGGFEDDEDLLP